MSFVASLLLLTVPQVFPGNDIKLPPRAEGAVKAAPMVRPLTEIERFRRDLVEMQGPVLKVEHKLQEMAQTYAPQALEALILEVARSARAHEMTNLMVVANRFGGTSPKVADELLFQLLVRPLAEATRSVVETMVVLKGDAARAALRECIRGRNSAVRRQAVDALIPMLGDDDFDFVMQLSREQTLDLQLRGIDLLRAMPGARGAPRLIELLSKPPTVAGASAAALIAMGPSAAPSLQAFTSQPAIDRGHVYACFVLARIAERVDPALLPESVAPALVKQLKDPDAMTRCLAAVPLADLAYRGVAGAAGHDVALVEALLDTVEPPAFVQNIDLLTRPAEERLLRNTGRLIVGTDGLTWRAWWKDQREGFTCVRARVDVPPEKAATAVVVWRQEQRQMRVLGEGLADTMPVSGAKEVIVSAPHMFELLSAMQAAGFGDEVALRVDSALPRTRSIAVQVPGARAQVAMPVTEHPAFERLVALVQAIVDEEAWQLYRDPATESDRAAFWRAERTWRDAHPSTDERGRRFFHRVVGLWPGLSTPLKARAIERLSQHPDRKQLVGEAEGERAVAMLAALPQLTELDVGLLELAVAAPGDKVWRTAVDCASRLPGGGPVAVRGLFKVLGPDAVLGALDDTSPIVRRAGVEQLMIVRDQRAAKRLIELLADPDLDVRHVAVGACGQLQLTAAAQPLVDIIAANDTTPLVRREALRSLGRIGTDLAFPVLQRALFAKAQDDKDAAMRGLGDLRDPRAAHVLADLLVIGHGKDLGTLARLHLLRQPGTLAVPALRAQLKIAQDATVRADLVLLVGGYHDASVVPELMDLLKNEKYAPQAATLLEGTTGVSFAAAQDRIDLIETWYRDHRADPQWQWLLDALRDTKTTTDLRPDHFAASAGLQPLAELGRLLIEAKEPRLWPLVAAVMRTVARDDFGVVGQDTDVAAREAIAARYRLLDETARAERGR